MSLGDPPTDILPLNGKDTHGERLAIPQQGQDHVWVRQLNVGVGEQRGQTSSGSFEYLAVTRQ